MAEEVREEEVEMTDDEIATLANSEIRKRDAEIKQLKKELARQKLLSNGDSDEGEELSREDLERAITSSASTDYDVWDNALKLRKVIMENGESDPFGSTYGSQTAGFIQSVLDDCDGDKNRFIAIYQSRLGTDDPDVAMAYTKYKKSLEKGV